MERQHLDCLSDFYQQRKTVKWKANTKNNILLTIPFPLLFSVGFVPLSTSAATRKHTMVRQKYFKGWGGANVRFGGKNILNTIINNNSEISGEARLLAGGLRPFLVAGLLSTQRWVEIKNSFIFQWVRPSGFSNFLDLYTA